MKKYYKILTKHPINFKEQAKYFHDLEYVNFINDIPYINFRGRFKTGESKNIIYPITILIYELSKLSNLNSTNYDDVIELITESGDRSKTIIDSDFPTYSIIGPWRSGLAQGLYLSYLIRLKVCNETSKFDELIHRAFSHLIAKRSDEGFCEDNCCWFEEYPLPNNHSYVLNGHLIALISIIEYHFVFKDSASKKLIKEFLSEFDRLVCNYDFFGWSKYCLYKNNLTNFSYHKLHVNLLRYFLEEQSYKELENVSKIYSKWNKSLNFYNNSVVFNNLIKVIRFVIGFKNRILFK